MEKQPGLVLVFVFSVLFIIIVVFLTIERTINTKHKHKWSHYYYASGSYLRVCKKCGQLQERHNEPFPITRHREYFWSNAPEITDKHIRTVLTEVYKFERGNPSR